MLAWFYATHEMEVGEGRPAIWRRVVLPAAGGLGDQDTRIMASIDHLRGVFNDRLIKQWAAKRRERK